MEYRPEQDNQKHAPQITYVNGLGFIPETPRQTEHKQLLMLYNVLLFSIMLFFFLRTATREPVDWLSAKLNLFVSPEFAVETALVLQMCVYMGLPALVVMMYNKKVIAGWHMFRTPHKGSLKCGTGIIVGTYALGIGLGWLFLRFMQMFGIAISAPADYIPLELPAFILYFFSVTFLPSFLLEFLFRGVILHSLRRFGDIVAMIASTVLYMLVQPTLEQMVQAFVMGMILGYFTLKSGSIWVAVTGSLVARAVFTLCRIASQYAGEKASELITYSMLFLMLLTGLAAFILFIRRDAGAFQIYDRDTYLSNRLKVKMLFGNFGFWMAVILAVMYVMQYIQIIG